MDRDTFFGECINQKLKLKLPGQVNKNLIQVTFFRLFKQGNHPFEFAHQ